jgi:hypothetical protein
MSRTISHSCSHCGHVDRVSLALGHTCPTCMARPSEPCRDLRIAGGRRMSTIHASREELAEIGVGKARRAVASSLRSVS